MSKQKKEIIIEIDDDGNISMDGVGFEGSECSLMDELARKLGRKTGEKLKPEYHTNQKTKQTKKVKA